ncbi:MAG TPA: Gfo/Idh/MocA family oxidoreductase [Candidatus Dormibacteraeota bacterium]
MSDRLGVGVVGCGTVSKPYLSNLRASGDVEVVACADQNLETARARAAEFGVPSAGTTDELLVNPRVELVVNLTVPNAHAEISLAALTAGKHVYTEKPLATTRELGRRVLEVAAERRLSVGCAPDTFLGAGIQTCLWLTAQGKVGKPLAASGFMLNRGPENWHPNPAFFYEPGGGPLLDVGPYYVTTLVCLLGPVKRVTGMSRILYPERRADRGPRAGETFKVSTDTFVAALIEFEGGAQATLVTSFGIGGHDLPNMQVYCTDAILGVPDPNTFGGPVRIRSNDEDSTWREVGLQYDHTDGARNFRGLGVIEMAQAIRRGEPPRASGELAYHVLDVLLSIVESSAAGRHIEVSSTCRRPPLLPQDAGLVATP